MKLAASDRTALLGLAQTLPKGSEERRAILAGLKLAYGLWRPPSGAEGNVESEGYLDGIEDDPLKAALLKHVGARKGDDLVYFEGRYPDFESGKDYRVGQETWNLGFIDGTPVALAKGQHGQAYYAHK